MKPWSNAHYLVGITLREGHIWIDETLEVLLECVTGGQCAVVSSAVLAAGLTGRTGGRCGREVLIRRIWTLAVNKH